MVMKRNSTSSHYRINQKKLNQNQSLKIKGYEHHRKTDKRCGSTHLVERKPGSKLFRSGKRQLQNQAGRMGRANRLFRLCLLDFRKGGNTTDQRHFGRTHRTSKHTSV